MTPNDGKSTDPSSQLGSGAAVKLGRSRDLLLDLTLRNRLLNFPQGDPGFKERDDRLHKNLPLMADIDQVWTRLVIEGESVQIYPRPEDFRSPEDAADLITNGDLCSQADDEHLEKRLQKLFREHQTLESSTGDSAFFLALGFLEWQEPPPKDTRFLFAPLLLLHVRLLRKNSPNGGKRSFVLQMDTDQHSGNPSLHEKLKIEHNLVLPSYEDVESPEAYLHEVEHAIRSMPKWKVHRSAALGFFNFARYRLWLDLDESQWPPGCAPAEHLIVSDLIDQKWRGDASALPTDSEIAEHQEEHDLPVVLEADGTQYASLMAASRGQSLVIIGPPGSGKSQTITNLIAVSLAQGKRVLFVAQKQAALMVVQRLLGECGLSPFCLPLYSDHSKPLDVHRQLHAAGAEHQNRPRRFQNNGQSLDGLARLLNGVAGSLGHYPDGYSDSVVSLIQRACATHARAKAALGSTWDDALLDIEIPDKAPKQNWFHDREQCLRELIKLRADAGQIWDGWRPLKLFAMDSQKIETSLRGVIDAAGAALEQMLSLPASLSKLPVDRLVQMMNQLERLPLPSQLVPNLLQSIWLAGDQQKEVHHLERSLKDYHRQRDKALSVLKDPVGNHVAFAQKILSATGALLERLGPVTTVQNAKQMLDDMALALDLVNDLVATAGFYPTGLESLQDSGEATLTFRLVDRLASRRGRVKDEIPSGIHIHLARHIVNNPESVPQILTLASQLDRAHSIANRVEQDFPDLMSRSSETRRDTANAVSIMISDGFRGNRLAELPSLRKTVFDHAVPSATVIALFEAPDGSLRRMTSTLTTESCRQLVKRRGTWTKALIEPPIAIHKTAIRCLVSGAVSPGDLLRWCDICDSAHQDVAVARRILTRATDETKGREEIPNLAKFSLGGANDVTVAELSRAGKKCRDTILCIDRGVQFFTVVAKALSQSPPTALEDFNRLAALTDSLRSMPQLPERGLLDSISSVTDISRVRTVMENCIAVIEGRARLANRVAFSDLPPREELSRLLKSLRTEQKRFFHRFRSPYRATRRSISGFIHPSNLRNIEVIATLEELQLILVKQEAIGADQTTIALLGPTFKTIDTNWKGAVEVLDWGMSFYAQLGERLVSLKHLASIRQRAGEKLAHAPQIIRQIHAIYGSLKSESAWSASTANLQRVTPQESDTGTNIATLRGSLASAADEFEAIANSLGKLGCATNVRLTDAWNAFTRLDQSRANFDGLNQMRDLLEASPRTIEISALRATIEWFRTNIEHGVPPGLLIMIVKQPVQGVQSVLKALEACERWVVSIDNLNAVAPQLCDERPLIDHHGVLSELLTVIDRCQPLLTGLTPGDLTVGDFHKTLAEVEEVEQVQTSSSQWNDILAEDAWRADLDRVRRSATWVRAMLDAGTSPRFILWCLDAETGPRFLWYQRLLSVAFEVWQKLAQLRQAGIVSSEEVAADISLHEWREKSANIYAVLAASVDVIARNSVSALHGLKDINGAATSMLNSCKLADELSDWESRLGTVPTSLRPTQISGHREWISAIGVLPTEFQSWLIEGDPNDRFGTAMETRGKLDGIRAAFEQLLKVMESFGPLTGFGPGQIKEQTLPIEDLRDRVAQLQKTIPRLLPWANLLRAEAVTKELGLETLGDAARRAQMPVESVVLAFYAAVSFQQAKSAWQADSRLVSFRGSEFNQLRARFAEADQNQLQKNRSHVVRQILERAKNTYTTANDKRCVTPEMYAILAHEENKQRKHWPIRKLTEHAGPLMQEFCPCWLMTPLGVAQFLKPGAVDFDIVIMDEASQLPPEDAWGAIARGKQLVVVGDPKQMPPSDFFSSASGEDDESDDELELDGAKLDSILDTAKNCMRQSDLLWHYRSRHQSLIAPANRFSYGDRLILFPSAHDRHPEMGIRHTFVPDAVATTGRVVNSKEALAVVDRLIQIAQNEHAKPPKLRLSVGVVAMNSQQMDCIQELLDAKRMTNRSIDLAISCLEENTAEPLLVMNLENVQGDQRDVILISYTYAPNTPGGTPANRFGPITLDGGERRFNVLITRAKWRMEVFASIRSDQIQISGKRPGVHHFYYFLKYAETGRLFDPGVGMPRSPDSPFEEHVIAVLKDDGYEVQPQVGVAGYFIDIAVRHPNDKDRFVLGIECDGATYHSSKAARDRDRLREQVLRDRGWKLYRIWSTDWFTNHEAAKEDLLVAVARICVADPDNS